VLLAKRTALNARWQDDWTVTATIGPINKFNALLAALLAQSARAFWFGAILFQSAAV